MKKLIKNLTDGITLKTVIYIVIGSAILTFGIHNIHQRTGITEGGVVGLMLLLENWLGVSPSVITLVLDALCYLLAFKVLGSKFIRLSAVATVFVSLFYKVWELLPYMLPDFSRYPLVAAVLGAVFVGVGFGLVIRQGGSCSGDDALALTIHKVTKLRLSLSYLATDITVLLLSLTYIPVKAIAFSLITVTLSSLLIDFVKSVGKSREVEPKK